MDLPILVNTGVTRDNEGGTCPEYFFVMLTLILHAIFCCLLFLSKLTFSKHSFGITKWSLAGEGELTVSPLPYTLIGSLTSNQIKTLSKVILVATKNNFFQHLFILIWKMSFQPALSYHLQFNVH